MFPKKSRSLDLIFFCYRLAWSKRAVKASRSISASVPTWQLTLPVETQGHHCRPSSRKVENCSLMATFRYSFVLRLLSICQRIRLLSRALKSINPKKGRWIELSSQDMLQMLGRAGRPQFRTSILSKFTQPATANRIPVWKQTGRQSQCRDCLGTVRNRGEAVQWLGFTYLYRHLFCFS